MSLKNHVVDDAIGNPFWICVGIISVVFAYYAFVLYSLVPTRAYDAFSYMWEAGISAHFFTGRSLSQRTLYYVLLNNELAIAYLQLAFHFVLACVLFVTFEEKLKESRVSRSVVLLGVLLFTSSYTFSVAAVYIGPEPIYLDLLLIFSCVLFGGRTKDRWLVVLIAGVLFVYSKSVAPFGCLVMLAIRIITLPSMPKRRLGITYLILALASVASIYITQKNDTSVHINTVNNFFVRIFPDEDLTEKYINDFGMPEGPYIESCAGKFAIDPFNGGGGLLVVDWITRNYDLRDDISGFPTWIREHGKRAYMDYLLSSPVRTTTEINRGFSQSFTNHSLLTVAHTMMHFNRTEGPLSNFDKMENLPGYWNGAPGGVDSLSALGRLFAILKLNNIPVALICFLISVGASRFRKDVSLFGMSAGCIGGALAIFFLSYFGDGMEIERHVFPAIILYMVGVIALFVGILSILLKKRFNALALVDKQDK